LNTGYATPMDAAFSHPVHKSPFRASRGGSEAILNIRANEYQTP
jgi:hypothetical protein